MGTADDGSYQLEEPRSDMCGRGGGAGRHEILADRRGVCNRPLHSGYGSRRMSGALTGRRLLVVEEALKDQVGHWYEYVKAVAELNRADGVEVTSVVHVRISPGIPREIAAIPGFARTPWDGDYARGWAP